MEEIWFDIPGYEEFYQISNTLKIKSLQRSLVDKHGRVYPVSEKLMNIVIGTSRYPHVILSKGRRRKQESVHRLVAQVFIPNPENKPCINHKNGIKTDYRIENLEWCTHSENTVHAFKTGLMVGQKGHPGLMGKDHPSARPVKQLTRNGLLVKEFGSIGDAARELGIDPSGITAVCRGRHSYIKGYIFRYVQN